MSSANPKVVVEKDDTSGIDTDRVSRILPILGGENIKKLLTAKVAVVGMSGGLGSEVAKNLILCGPGTIYLCDEGVIDREDLSGGFYFQENEIGQSRIGASLYRFQALNPYCAVRGMSEALTDEFVKSLTAIVFCNAGNPDQVAHFSELAHRSGVACFTADVRGLFVRVFSDFGESHVVRDPTGEEHRASIISNVTKGAQTTITIHDDRHHGLSVGDHVTLSEIRGLQFPDTLRGSASAMELDTPDLPYVYCVSAVHGVHSFDVDFDSSALEGSYEGGGLVQQINVELPLPFHSRAHCLAQPGDFIISDFAKLEHAAQLHVLFQALDEWQRRHGGALPHVMHDADTEAFRALAEEVNARCRQAGAFAVDKVDPALCDKLCLTSAGSLAPLAVFVGGVVAQEVLKLTGKFRPIHQWFYFDTVENFVEAARIPASVSSSSALETAAGGYAGTPFAAQAALLGSDLQRFLCESRLFLVGTGALGCEFLKNLALMGVCQGHAGGQLVVTDLDNIEKSNLSRQFLFRDADIGAMKAPTAVKAARAMREGLSVRCETTAVGPSTENLWDDGFWESLTCVVNALDNVKARLYVDSKCVWFRKPLLESGTLGTKANSQVIYPHVTESYASSRDPPEASVPMCTLKNFPHEIEHTIEWARDRFGGVFMQSVEDLQRYREDPEGFLKLVLEGENVVTKKERLLGVRSLARVFSVARVAGDDYLKACAEWARRRFEEWFNQDIRQLLYNFPKDAKTREGQPFWSGPKRPPTPLAFDPSQDEHADFAVAAAQCLAQALGRPLPHAAALFGGTGVAREVRDKVLHFAARYPVKEFRPRGDVRIKEGDSSTVEEGASDDDQVVNRLAAELRERGALWDSLPAPDQLDPLAFEKDDDGNGHVHFITAASNARASNYAIKPASFHKTKVIAGKIIPAIATTTAMITGLVCLEVYKVFQALLEERRMAGGASPTGEAVKKMRISSEDEMSMEEEDPQAAAAASKRKTVLLETFRNSFVNLALPSFVQAEPVPCTENKSTDDARCVPEGFTLWDAIVIEGDLTIAEVKEYFMQKFGFEMGSMSIGNKFAYSSYFPAHNKRLPLKVSEWTRENVPDLLQPASKYVPITVLLEDPENDEISIEMPEKIALKFKN